MGFPHLHAGMPCPPGAVPVRALNRWHAATRPMFVCDGVAQRRINRNARPISPRTPRRAQPYGIASRPTAHKTSLNAKATHLRSGRSACRDGGASSKFPIAHWGDRHIATLPQRLPHAAAAGNPRPFAHRMKRCAPLFATHFHHVWKPAIGWGKMRGLPMQRITAPASRRKSWPLKAFVSAAHASII